MTLRYLLDTNVVSCAFRPRPPVKVMENLDKYSGECAICTPVWHELRFGLALLPPSRRHDALERFLYQVVLPNYPLLEYDRPAAEWHAIERARLRQAGQEPPLMDAQIASIAASNSLVLVTHNVADFDRFDGLDMEDWQA